MLGVPVMQQLRSWIRGCPEPVIIENGGHFLQEDSPREFADAIKGKYGDISNLGEAGAAGSIAGAEFLKHFVGDTPWVHVDIAGTAWGMKRNYVGNGASGYGVRLMIELARSAT